MVDLDVEKVCLRNETASDHDFLLQLYISIREAELILLGWSQVQIQPFLTQQFEAQSLSYRQFYPDADFQLVEYQGQPIGRLYLYRGEDEYRLIDIALLPAFRNQKLGRYLIQNLLNTAIETGVPVSLHVEYLNPAHRLYKRLGFVEVDDGGPLIFMKWSPNC